MTFREEVANIIGFPIAKGQYKDIIRRVDSTGGFNQRKIMELLILCLERLEALDNESSTIQSTKN